MHRSNSELAQPPILDGNVILRVENLSKKFCRTLKRSILYGSTDVARSMIGLPCNSSQLRRDEFWALDDISFELTKGETLGIIGVNGSGKSTLLRLITGIYPPDKGKIVSRGRIGALIAVGAGFHPYMTGKENIYLNGTILGMTRKEIESKIDEIIDFAEIGNFLDAPVSTYSSGMRVRLGFSIAVHCEPDILLVDEILSVGDLAFRNKSMRKMDEFRAKANALIFISHSLEQIRALCGRVIILDKGKVLYDGATHEGLVKYEEMGRDIRLKNSQKSVNRNFNLISYEGDASESVILTDIKVCDQNEQKIESIDMDSSVSIFCDFKVTADVTGLYFSIGILNDEYRNCIWVFSNEKHNLFNNLSTGEYRLKLSIDNHHLQPGVYFPTIAVRNSKTAETYERVLSQCSFKVKSNGTTLERGIVSVNKSWELSKIN